MEDTRAAVKNDLENNDAAAAVAKIKKYLEDKKKIPLDIAITGESGSGKSTFFNAFRGVGDEDEGAAPAGVTETTMEVTKYPHPNYPNVTLWDLPGVGTTKFPAAKYLEHVGFEKYDFFIIISAVRFTENDVKLAQEIQKMKKNFYFVRSKIDNDINAERRKKNFSKEGTLKKLREDCVQGLKDQGIKSPQVFLVSSFDLHQFDFPFLHETLERELPQHKRDVLLFTVPSINEEIIDKKREAFQSNIDLKATACAFAGIPIPGLSAVINLALMVDFVTDYVVGFGLDEPSLERLADSTGVSYTDLCAVIKSPLVKETITAELLDRLLSSIESTAGLLTAAKVTSCIPLFGIIPTMTLSGTLANKALYHFLYELAEDAKRVFERALKGAQ